ncbi:GNAT family N-acetyltransferase [Anaerorhabdus sp.]|uniref:GNAT family N-acetyltransferase n=1 Tax=Anaerorhabdus sp. TaxID=1872524 RepID=UPI002FC5EF2A
MENIIIRKAIENDRKALAQVCAHAFQHDWSIVSENSNIVAHALGSGINIEAYLVATIDNEIAGFLSYVTGNQRAQMIHIKNFQKAAGFFKGYAIAMMIKKEFEEPLHFNENQVYIDILGIEPKFHHLGIATQLIQYLIQNTDFTEYILKVTTINVHAIECYKKNGFVEYKREKVKYPKQMGFDAYIYMKRNKQ